MIQKYNEYIKESYPRSYTREETFDFDKYKYNEKLIDLFDKYNTYKIDFEEPEWVGMNDVLKSLEQIDGDGKIRYGNIDGISYPTPEYIEEFPDGDTVLLVFGHNGGLTSMYLYEYEVKVLSKKSRKTTQYGGGYGASGFDMADYTHYAWITADNCPQIGHIDVIGKVISEFRKLFI